MTTRKLISGAIASAWLLAAIAASATWSTDPFVNNPVCVSDSMQIAPVVLPASGGGTFVVWSDERSGDWAVYAQLVDEEGVPQWPNAVPVCTYASIQNFPVLCDDGAGGFIVAWADNDGGQYDIYAQRINALGSRLWAPAGAAVCVEAAYQNAPQIAIDGVGGAFVCWQDGRGGADDLYAQRLNSSGTRLWGNSGLPICSEAGDQNSAKIVFDGIDGAVLAWRDERAAPATVYVQRVDKNGSALWTAGGVAMPTMTYDCSPADIASDGASGAFVAFHEANLSVFTGKGYVVRVDGDGNRPWWPRACGSLPSGDYQWGLDLAEDGAGGVFVGFFQGTGTYTVTDVYAQHVTASGTLWSTDAVLVSDAPSAQYYPDVCADGDGGMYIVWPDSRHYTFTVYAQRLNGLGVPLWSEGGELVSWGPGASSPVCVTDSDGKLVVAFADDRNDEGDIFAQRLDGNGYLGDSGLAITAVEDLPNDQGGAALVAWDAPYFDAQPLLAVTSYSLWARPQSGAKSVLPRTEAAALADKLGWSADWIQKYAGAGWTFVVDVPALQESAYAATAFTFGDSTENGIPLSVYRVVAHGREPHIFWESAPDSGYSVDNLAPGAPEDLAGVYAIAGQVRLTWGASGVHDEDLAHYTVYRGAAPGFPLDSDHRAGETTDLEYGDPTGGGDWYYRVTAVDVHGNEGPPSAEILVDDPTGVPPFVPTEYAFRGTYPNPFNPQTTIVFDLPEAAPVRLEIFALDGRRVGRLVAGVLSAGRHRIPWNARDTEGRSLASGVYLVRWEAGRHTATRRVMLVR
jgi:hypothetical protein